MLHQPVLAGMVGDHGDDPVRHEPVAQHRQRPFQDAEFVVDGDAYGLKERRELGWPAPWAKHGPDRVDEIVARPECPRGTAAHDFPRQPPRLRFVGVLAENANQFVFVAFVENVRAIRVRIWSHAHVEWRARAEREASSFLVDLVRRNAEVEQDAVPRFAIELRSLVDVREVGAHRAERCASAVAFNVACGGINGVGILIDAGDVGAVLEEGECVTASSKRAVQNVPSVAEQLGDLASENRRVKGWDSG